MLLPAAAGTEGNARETQVKAVWEFVATGEIPEGIKDVWLAAGTLKFVQQIFIDLLLLCCRCSRYSRRKDTKIV